MSVSRVGVRRAAIAAACLAGLVGAGVTAQASPAHSSPGLILFDRATKSHTQVFSVAPDGSGVTQLTHDSGPTAGLDNTDPVLSPDGTRIAFLGGNHVFVMGSDGSGITDLTPRDGSDLTNQQLAFTPDGSKIVFARATSSDPSFDIWEMSSTDGSGLTDLTRTPGTDDVNPAVNPANGSIAYERNGEIWTMSSTGSHQIHLTALDADFPSEPAWSPDGLTLAFIGSQADVWTYRPASGTPPTQLTSSNASVFAASPSWAPDGTALVIQGSGRPDGDPVDLYTVDLSTGTETKVPNTSDSQNNSIAENPHWGQTAPPCSEALQTGSTTYTYGDGSDSYTISFSADARDARGHDVVSTVPHVKTSGGCCAPGTVTGETTASVLSTGANSGQGTVDVNFSFPTCVGQSYTTKSGSGFVQLKYADGSRLDLAQQSHVAEGGCTSPERHRYCLTDPEGHLYAQISGGSAGSLQVKSGGAVLQIHGGAVTVAAEHGRLLAHLIEGSGSIRLAGRTVRFWAGQGVLVTGKSTRITDAWSPKDRALVPSTQRPPVLTGLRLASGTPLRAQVRLDHKARLRVRLVRNGKVVETVRAAGRAGVNRVALKPVPRGRYILQVTATDSHHRAATAQRGITIRARS